MKKHLKYIGHKFGRLLIKELKYKKLGKSYYVYALCLCDCKKEKLICLSSILSGRSKSCGCRQGKYKHGMYKTKEYFIWSQMIQRCTNPKDKGYKYWGGRGISVCKRWLSFANFYKDMGKKPKNYSIDRINNDGNYCPSNCRWASRQDQAFNQRHALGISMERYIFCDNRKRQRKWHVVIDNSRHKYYSKYYKTKDEAIKDRNKHIEELFGIKKEGGE